jgi:hypothetical protein
MQTHPHPFKHEELEPKLNARKRMGVFMLTHTIIKCNKLLAFHVFSIKNCINVAIL